MECVSLSYTECLIGLPVGNRWIKIEPVRDWASEEEERKKKESIRSLWPSQANLRRIYDDF